MKLLLHLGLALAVAALSLALGDRLDEARMVLVSIRERAPDYRFADFVQAFRLDETGESVFRAGARLLGLPP